MTVATSWSCWFGLVSFEKSSAHFAIWTRLKMVSSGALFSAVALLAASALTTTTTAHGTVKVPAAELLPGHGDDWIVILKPAWPWEGAGSWKGGDQVGQFAKLSKKNGFATLRSFLDDKGQTCGYTNAKATPKAIPADGNVVFTHNDAGFTHQVL